MPDVTWLQEIEILEFAETGPEMIAIEEDIQVRMRRRARHLERG